MYSHLNFSEISTCHPHSHPLTCQKCQDLSDHLTNVMTKLNDLHNMIDEYMDKEEDYVLRIKALSAEMDVKIADAESAHEERLR